jgi:hypothetical protein
LGLFSLDLDVCGCWGLGPNTKKYNICRNGIVELVMFGFPDGLHYMTLFRQSVYPY